MATLTNTKIKDTYDGLLKTADNDVIGASEKNITDGLGNATVLSIGTDSASFSNNVSITGSLTASNAVTAGTVSVGDAIVHTGDTDTKIEFLSNQIKTTLGGTLEINSTITGTIFYKDIEVNGLTIGKGNGSQSANTAIGINSLSSTTGNQNTAIGYNTLPNNTTGQQNIAIGVDAMQENISGLRNVAIGYGSLKSNTNAIDNVAVGYLSLFSNTTGGQNAAFGALSLYNNTTGGSNTALGYNALSANIIGSSNVAVGRSALISNTGSFNTAVGTYSLNNNTTGSDNVAIGYRSLYNTTTGELNVAIGNYALDFNTTGLYNTALGHRALYSNETGGSNVAVGYHALRENTASNNTSVGHASLTVNTTGAFNSAFGRSALNTNTTGSYNVAIGYNSLLSNTDGDLNVAVGYAAGDNKTSGDRNIYIGNQAEGGSATTSNEMVIGSLATGNGSDTATYGNANITSHHFTAGQVNVAGNLAVDTNTLYVDAANNRVGVGITPSEKFHVAGSGRFEGNSLDVGYGSSASELFLQVGQGRTGNGYAYLDLIGDETYSDFGLRIFRNNTGANASSSIYHRGTGDFSLQATDVAPILFKTQSAERMRITSAGNVGIGTTSPTSGVSSNQTVLEIAHDNIPALALNDTGGSKFTIYSSGGNLSFYDVTNSAERMRIDSGGTVKISGTTNEFSLDIQKSSQPKLRLFQNDGSLNPRMTISCDNTGTLFDHTFSSSANAVRFAFSGSEKMRIDSSGNVGIGGVPTGKFEVFGSGGDWRIEPAGVRMTFDNATGGYIRTEQAVPLIFETNGSNERMRIDSDGNVGIGGSPITKLTLEGARNTNTLTFRSTDNDSGWSSGDEFGAIEFYSNDASGGGAGVKSAISCFTTSSSGANSELSFSTSSTGSNNVERMRIDGVGNVGIGIAPSYRMHLHNTSTDFDATTDLAFGVTSNDSNTNARAVIKALKGGTNGGQLTISTLSGNVLSERVRFLSGGGITFNGDTSSANALDDYEEGTWTPTVGGTWTTNPTGLSGKYTKIGNVVYIQLLFTGGVKSTSVSGYFTGLPYATNNTGTASVVNAGVQNKGLALFANTDRVWLTDTDFGVSNTQLTGFYYTNA